MALRIVRRFIVLYFLQVILALPCARSPYRPSISSIGRKNYSSLQKISASSLNNFELRQSCVKLSNQQARFFSTAAVEPQHATTKNESENTKDGAHAVNNGTLNLLLVLIRILRVSSNFCFKLLSSYSFPLKKSLRRNPS